MLRMVAVKVHQEDVNGLFSHGARALSELSVRAAALELTSSVPSSASTSPSSASAPTCPFSGC